MFKHPFHDKRHLYLERKSILFAGCSKCGKGQQVLDKKRGMALLKAHDCILEGSTEGSRT